MILELKFSIGDRVQITEVERPGKVLSVWLTKTGTQYEVRYFDKAEAKSIYFYEDELTPR
jgi:uncharacterized protein YodC (DUF2158 family)